MWLDRLSTATNSASPSGSISPSRPYSPAPRKNSQLAPPQRTGLGLAANRSSASLDLSANTSTSSLLSPPQRITNGSSLRFEQRPPPDIPDPLNVLRSILKTSQEAKQSKAGTRSKPPREEDIDFGGLSLQEFADHEEPVTQATAQARGPTLSGRESRRKYEEFHHSIRECDQVLKTVETYLTNFKAELGQVSAEIENLQARSVQLTAKLDNRRKVEKLLGPAVEDVSLSPHTVRAIAEGPIDDNFVKALKEIEARSVVIEEKAKKDDQVKVLQDLKPLLDDLKAKAVERVRDYIVTQIKALRSPNINAQVIQQSTLLKYKDVYAFLSRAHPALAEEIGQAYINTMKWYYASHFSRYHAALASIPLHTFEQHDLIGAEAAPARRTVLGAAAAAKPPQQQQDAFSLARRSDVLSASSSLLSSQSSPSALPAHLATPSSPPQHLEVPFHNFNLALLDNVCAEYAVVTDFFSTSSYHTVSRHVLAIFEPTFQLGHALAKSLVESTTDTLGVLLCVRLNQQAAFALQRRKVPVMDAYVNYTNILLWPRFQQIMDAQLASLRTVPTGARGGASAAFALVGGGGGGAAASSASSVAPHAVTQRFGQFLAGILQLSAEAGDDEPVANSLARLRGEYEVLMGKLAKSVGAGKRDKFLFNNYSLVLTIISDAKGKLAEGEKEHFGDLVRELKGR